MEPMLLTEDWGQPGKAGDRKMFVESKEVNGKLYIEGVFLQAEVVNGNERLYPKKVLQEAVAKYNK